MEQERFSAPVDDWQTFRISLAYRPEINLAPYRILHSCGKSYIGQIRCSFRACIKEHIANTSHKPFRNKLLLSTNLSLNIPFASLKLNLSLNSRLQFMHDSESFGIEKHLDNFNCKDNYKLNQSWKPVIHQLEHETSPTSFLSPSFNFFP